MNAPIYKEAARSGFQTVNAEDWENEALFKWQGQRINELAMQRKISYKKLKEMIREVTGSGKELVGELNRKEGIKVIEKLKGITFANCWECMDTGFAVPSGKACGFCARGKSMIMGIEKRKVGNMKVREF